MTFEGSKWSEAHRAKIMARIPSPKERLFARIEYDTNGGCWLWAGAMPQESGYGTLTHGSRTIGAHRLSYELHHGLIPAGMHVCHKCDVRACVNPAHLFLGTPSDNAMDMYRKGRGKPRRGETNPKAKIAATDVPVIMARLGEGEPCADIARDYGVTDCAVNAIRRGNSWNHITGLPNSRRKTA